MTSIQDVKLNAPAPCEQYISIRLRASLLAPEISGVGGVDEVIREREAQVVLDLVDDCWVIDQVLGRSEQRAETP